MIFILRSSHNWGVQGIVPCRSARCPCPLLSPEAGHRFARRMMIGCKFRKGMAMVIEIKHTTAKNPLYPVAKQVKTFTFDALPLQRGGQFGPVTLAYETWGTLNAAADNMVLITHALTGNTHAHDVERPHDTKVAWWNPLIGPGRFFDTTRFFVICSNILGGCYGSTGPSSPDPQTGRPYGMRFPVVTIRDMVGAQHKLVEHLGVRRIFM